MSTENQFWDYLQPRLAPYGRAVRIENLVGSGTPDVYYRFRVPEGLAGQGAWFAGWLELKHLDDEPSRPGTPIVIPTLTKQQTDWLTDEQRAGGRAHLLLRMNKRIYVLSAGAAELVRRRELTRQSFGHHVKYASTPGLIRIAEIVRCLADG